MNKYEVIAELIRIALAEDNHAPRLLREHVPHIEQLHTKIADQIDEMDEAQAKAKNEYEDNIQDAMTTLEDALTELAVDPDKMKTILWDVQRDLEA